MTTPHPIDTRQHMWWHRLRRLGRWGFALLAGAVLSPLVTCLLFGGVIIYFSYPLSTFVRNGALIWMITAPMYIAACLWTWSHMEKRYRDTLPARCPGCGYSLEGTPVMDDGRRCPECGEVVGDTAQVA